MEHTKGKAKVFNRLTGKISYPDKLTVCINNEIVALIPVPESGQKHLSNAELIAEAFNVTNETGKTPRELQKENEILSKLATEFLDNIYFPDLDKVARGDYNKLKAVLATTKSKPSHP